MCTDSMSIYHRRSFSKVDESQLLHSEWSLGLEDNTKAIYEIWHLKANYFCVGHCLAYYLQQVDKYNLQLEEKFGNNFTYNLP